MATLKIYWLIEMLHLLYSGNWKIGNYVRPVCLPCNLQHSGCQSISNQWRNVGGEISWSHCCQDPDSYRRGRGVIFPWSSQSNGRWSFLTSWWLSPWQRSCTDTWRGSIQVSATLDHCLTVVQGDDICRLQNWLVFLCTALRICVCLFTECYWRLFPVAECG